MNPQQTKFSSNRYHWCFFNIVNQYVFIHSS